MTCLCLQLTGFGSLSGNSGGMSKSWSTTGFVSTTTPPSPSSSGPIGGIGKNWAIKPQDMRKYMLEFNSLDVSKTGFISGKGRDRGREEVKGGGWQGEGSRGQGEGLREGLRGGKGRTRGGARGRIEGGAIK